MFLTKGITQEIKVKVEILEETKTTCRLLEILKNQHKILEEMLIGPERYKRNIQVSVLFLRTSHSQVKNV